MNKFQKNHLMYNMASVLSVYRINVDVNGNDLPIGESRLADKNSDLDKGILESKLNSLISERDHIEVAESEGKLVAKAWTDEVKKAYYAVFDYFTQEDVFYGLHYDSRFISSRDLISEVRATINKIVKDETGVDLNY